MNIDANIYDVVTADSLIVGDQTIIDGDYIEVKSVTETDDIDEIIITGYSHTTGDTETYSLFADDFYDLWAI